MHCCLNLHTVAVSFFWKEALHFSEVRWPSGFHTDHQLKVPREEQSEEHLRVRTLVLQALTHLVGQAEEGLGHIVLLECKDSGG